MGPESTARHRLPRFLLGLAILLAGSGDRTSLAQPARIRSDADLAALESRRLPLAISDAIWWADVGGSQPSVTVHDRTSGSLVRALSVSFRPRASALMRDGRAAFFGRDQALVLDRFGEAVASRPGEFSHSLGGFIKTSAASSDHPFILLGDQFDNRVVKIHLDEFLLDPDPVGGYSPAVRPWSTLLTDLDPDIKRPRGMAQGRVLPDPAVPTKVWVACKGANSPGPQDFTSVVSLDLASGQILNAITTLTDAPLRRLPFGARGVCIDTSHPDRDTVWVSCFGEQIGQPLPGHENTTGNGNQVLRIRDLNPLDATDGYELTVIRLGRNPEVRRGPFGIVCSVSGDVFVACGRSNEIWRIPSDVDHRKRPNGSPLLGPDASDDFPPPMGQFLPANPGAIPGWPVRLPGRGGPLAIGIGGDHSLWVHQKDGNRMFKIDPATGRVEDAIPQGLSSPAGPRSRLIDSVSTENLGDFTGYHTAAVLFPADDTNGDGLANRASLERGINPFAPLPVAFRPR